MKKYQKCIVITGIIAVILAVAVSIFATGRFRRPLVAFYRIPEQNIPFIKSLLEKDADFKEYDNKVSLYSQLQSGRKPDILLTTSGQPLKTAESLAPKNTSVPLALFADITTSIRSAATKAPGENYKSLPLLASHFEVDINVRKLRKTSVKNINTWDDIASFIRESKKKNNDLGLIFAGRDGTTTLDLLSALAEALNGKAAYDAAVTIIQDTIAEYAQKEKPVNLDDVASRLVEGMNAPLYDAAQFLRKWIKDGLITAESFSMDRQTLSAFMQNNMASVAIMSLADHRSIKHDIIEPFTSIFFPSEMSPELRHFVAPVYYAVPFSQNSRSTALLKKLISTETQESLSYATGLAPALARCKTPDKQANDARYWIAATNAPLPGLSRETSLSDEQLRVLGAALANLIRKYGEVKAR